MHKIYIEEEKLCTSRGLESNITLRVKVSFGSRQTTFQSRLQDNHYIEQPVSTKPLQSMVAIKFIRSTTIQLIEYL